MRRLWIGSNKQREARMTVQRRNLMIVAAAAGLAAPRLVWRQGALGRTVPCA